MALGVISYGVYLWHFPVAFWLGGLAWPIKAPMVAVIAIWAATVSYLFVERPLQRMRRRQVVAV